jgi:hypothetical protein
MILEFMDLDYINSSDIFINYIGDSNNLNLNKDQFPSHDIEIVILFLKIFYIF